MQKYIVYFRAGLCVLGPDAFFVLEFIRHVFLHIVILAVVSVFVLFAGVLVNFSSLVLWWFVWVLSFPGVQVWSGGVVYIFPLRSPGVLGSDCVFTQILC